MSPFWAKIVFNLELRADAKWAIVCRHFVARYTLSIAPDRFAGGSLRSTPATPVLALSLD